MHRIRVRTMLVASAVFLLALATPVFSQTTADNPSKDSKAPADVSVLKQQVAEQQKEIEQLRAIVDQMKQKLDLSPSPAQAVAKPAQTTTTQAPDPGQVASTSPMAPKTAEKPAASSDANMVASTTPMVPKATEKSAGGSSGNLLSFTLIPPAAAHSATQALPPKEAEQVSPPVSPLQFHIGSATFTPVGFMDFTSVWRNHAAGGNIGTSFGSIPYAAVRAAYSPTRLI